MTDYQHVYLYMDDSGKISRYEDYAIFAGIVFTNTNQKSEFSNKYRRIINDIKCNYCESQPANCDKKCVEVKASHISNSDRRRIMQLSKKFITFGVIIYNKNIQHKDIIDRPQSKGRFVEYYQRRIIKRTMEKLIFTKQINPNKPIYLHVNIDEMPTKTNGYYTLREGIREEFLSGIINFNYQKTFKPIIFSDFDIDVLYKDSKYDLGIQMADILANTIRRSFTLNNNWFDSYDYITKKLDIDVVLRLPN